MPTYYDRIYSEAASCNTTGNITWTAAATQFALPPAAVDATVEYTLLDSGGTKWETGRAALSESGGTYTITRGGAQTVLAGSNGASAESFTSASTHKLFIAPSAAKLTTLDVISENYVQGLLPKSASDTTIDVSAGEIMVEGKRLSTTGISGETVTTTNTGIYYIYAYDNSGFDLDYSQTAPTWNSTYRYYDKGGDPTYRLIGYYIVYTSGTNKLRRFFTLAIGEKLRLFLYDGASTNAVIDLVTANSLNDYASGWAAITLTGICPANCDQALWVACALNVKASSANADTNLYLGFAPVQPSTSQTPGFGATVLRASTIEPDSTASAYFNFANSRIPITTTRTVYWATQVNNIGAGAGVLIRLSGVEFAL